MSMLHYLRNFRNGNSRPITDSKLNAPAKLPWPMVEEYKLIGPIEKMLSAGAYATFDTYFLYVSTQSLEQ